MKPEEMIVTQADFYRLGVHESYSDQAEKRELERRYSARLEKEASRRPKNLQEAETWVERVTVSIRILSALPYLPGYEQASAQSIQAALQGFQTHPLGIAMWHKHPAELGMLSIRSDAALKREAHSRNGTRYLWPQDPGRDSP